MMTAEQLQLRDVKGVGPKRLDSITNKLAELNKPVHFVFSLSPEEIKATFGLPINVATALAKVKSSQPPIEKTEASVPVETTKPGLLRTIGLSPLDVVVLEYKTSKYPEKLKKVLGEKAPEKLYVWGNLKLLERPAVGFCGSRNVSQKGLDVTADTAQQLAELNWVVVSGHARGVDTIAHKTALENGAGTIVVLPQGIDGFKLRRELRPFADSGQLLIVSEFSPTAGWNVGYAMQRNATIIGLSDAMVLVESRLEGGTFNAGQTALKLNCPLFVASYQVAESNNEGNVHFIKHGAQQLFRNRETGRANISKLKAIVETQTSNQSNINSNIESDPRPKQMTFLNPTKP